MDIDDITVLHTIRVINPCLYQNGSNAIDDYDCVVVDSGDSFNESILCENAINERRHAQVR